MSKRAEEAERLVGLRLVERIRGTEVKLPRPVLTIYDSYPDPFSSGSNGYITKVRVRSNALEFYHDWWDYGWKSYSEMKKINSQSVKEVIRILIKIYDKSGESRA